MKSSVVAICYDVHNQLEVQISDTELLNRIRIYLRGKTIRVEGTRFFVRDKKDWYNAVAYIMRFIK